MKYETFAMFAKRHTEQRQLQEFMDQPSDVQDADCHQS